MNPWITVIGTLLGVLIGGGLTFLNNTRSRKWAIEDRDKVINEAREQWRWETSEQRAVALRDQRIAVFARLMIAIDTAYNKVITVRTKQDHGKLATGTEDAVEALASAMAAGTVLAEVEIIGPEGVRQAGHDALEVVIFITSTLSRAQSGKEDISAAGELMKTRRKDMLQSMQAAIAGDYRAVTSRSDAS